MKNLDPATPRVSARNQNKNIAELEERSAMELELENLPKISKASKIPKKTITKKSTESAGSLESIITETEDENEKVEEMIISEKNISKELTPKKSKKIEVGEIAQKKTPSKNRSEILSETEIVKIPKSTTKKSKKQEKEDLIEKETETIEEESEVKSLSKKTPISKSKKIATKILETVGSENDDDKEEEKIEIAVPLKTPKKNKKSKDSEEENMKLTENEFSEDTPEKSVKIGNKNKSKNSVTDSQVKKGRK